MKTVTNTDARALIRDRVEFRNHTGAFSGQTHTPGYHVGYTGYLPRAYESYGRLQDADYIVFSYATPIAWHLADGWVIPDVSYSATTSTRHMPNLLLHGEPMSKYHLPTPWQLGLPAVAGGLLRILRLGRGIDVSGRSKRTIDALLATGEVRWHEEGVSLVHVDRTPSVVR